jgi:hypothetical protein
MNDHSAQRLRDSPVLIIGAAAVAAVIKIYLAAVTLGTNDVVAFYQFAKAMREHGLTWLYTHSILFNHPPLVGYYLAAILSLDSQMFAGGAFPLLLRLPGIAADLLVVLGMLWVGRKEPTLRLPQWALLLFALSPVSIMVTGFHGNTDPVMTMLLFFAALMILANRPLSSGILLALACQIKIIPLLFLPVFVLHWHTRRRTTVFITTFATTWILLSGEPLLRVPRAFARNVLSYGGFWGTWGFTSLLRLSGFAEFSKVNYFGLSSLQVLVATALKLLVIAAAVVIAWRRRSIAAGATLLSIAYICLVLFVFSPAIAPQYLVWCMSFVLLFSPNAFALVVASSSVFLFAFYTIASGGLPWYFSHATPALNSQLSTWALLPWLTFAVVLLAQSRKAQQHCPGLRFFASKSLMPPFAPER